MSEAIIGAILGLIGAVAAFIGWRRDGEMRTQIRHHKTMREYAEERAEEARRRESAMIVREHDIIDERADKIVMSGEDANRLVDEAKKR